MAESRTQPEGERVGRLFVALAQVNHAVAQSRSRAELLEEVVRALVESAGFAMAFIARHDPASHELAPVARFGDAGHYLDRVKMFADESPEGQGPAGTAFRTRAPYYCNDFLNDPRTILWRDAAYVGLARFRFYPDRHRWRALRITFRVFLRERFLRSERKGAA
jgi:GAF domain-containing protein